MSQLRRRQFLLAVGAGSLSAVLPALAQQEKRMRRIGFLGLSSAQATVHLIAAFHEGMKELHWVEGRDYALDTRHGNGIAPAMGGLAAELVATQPDLILTMGDATVGHLAQSTKTIPVVFALGQDPVGNGFAADLRRPGGNVTGLTTLVIDIGVKRLQLLKEAFPRVTHVALFFESGNVGNASEAKAIETAATRLGMRVTSIGLRQPADIEPAFKRGIALGVQAYMVAEGGVANSQRQVIADRISGLKVPSIAGFAEYVEAGGLMAYSAIFRDNFRRAAAYVDKILKGAKPGDLPIEQPTKFEFVLNLKTAKAMGIKIPQSFLVRVDRVIE